MNYKVGDRVKIKSLDWYKENRNDINNPYEEGRSNYQILFRVWDWTQYDHRSKDHDYNVDVTILVSRTADERVELELSHDDQPISSLRIRLRASTNG